MCGGTGVQGSRVTTNVFIRDLDLAEFRWLDGRRIEVIADGLPLFQGAQLATVFNPHLVGVVVSHPFVHVVSPTDSPRPAQSTSLKVTAPPEVVPGAGPRRLTRFLEMPRDLFYSTLRGLINAGRFNHIGHPNVRLEASLLGVSGFASTIGEELTAPSLALGVVSSTMSPIES